VVVKPHANARVPVELEPRLAVAAVGRGVCQQTNLAGSRDGAVDCAQFILC